MDIADAMHPWLEFVRAHGPCNNKGTEPTLRDMPADDDRRPHTIKICLRCDRCGAMLTSRLTAEEVDGGA